MSQQTPLQHLDEQTKMYVRKMPYLKALMLSELQNDLEIYRYINVKDIKFKNDITSNFLNGLRGGMNELYTDFKKQFEKLKTSQQSGQPNQIQDGGEGYQVSIMYDKYYVRKKEIADNILMIVICDVEQDGTAYLGDNDAEGEQ